MKSLPSRERGLKCNGNKRGINKNLSLPSRERGLKYRDDGKRKRKGWVAPLAGAWIEINVVRGYARRCRMSLPSRERGLKFHRPMKQCRALQCRSPRGSVD